MVTIEKEHAPPDPALASKRILVVDDDPEIRLFVCHALEHKGYSTDTAADGKAALAIIMEKPPDLLVLDAMLPLLHGFELCRQLKSDERTRAIPIIMVTAVYRGWRFAQDTRETYGADYYLEKPFHLSDLLGRVESALGTPARPDARRDYAAERCRRGVELFQAGHIEQALGELDRAAKDDPFSPACHYYLALALSAHGDDYAAMTSFERAVELRPNLFPALRTLASIYTAKGFRRKAIESYERALRVAPDEATHAQIKDELLALI